MVYKSTQELQEEADRRKKKIEDWYYSELHKTAEFLRNEISKYEQKGGAKSS